jgi:hypothetical protein
VRRLGLWWLLVNLGSSEMMVHALRAIWPPRIHSFSPCALRLTPLDGAKEQDLGRKFSHRSPLPSPSLVSDGFLIILEDFLVDVKILVLLLH